MKFCGKTDVGKKRETNQDNFYAESIELENGKTLILAVVCDGMGGVSGGSVASEHALKVFVKTFLQTFNGNEGESSALLPDEDVKIADDKCENVMYCMKNAVYMANMTLYELSQKEPALSGMGTTLVGCVAYDGYLYVVNVGDSRLYLVNEDAICQLTSDHSFVQSLIDKGHITAEEAKNHPNKNVIMRAIGIDREVAPDTFKVQIENNSVLLCSDGLSNNVPESELKRIIMGNNSPEEICNSLVCAANDNGGPDNITALVLKP